jgi:exonuclease VII large subunit
LRTATGRLTALDPEQPLARGYALIFRGGSLVRSARDVAVGDGVVARLGHGTLDARVEAVRDE